MCNSDSFVHLAWYENGGVEVNWDPSQEDHWGVSDFNTATVNLFACQLILLFFVFSGSLLWARLMNL